MKIISGLFVIFSSVLFAVVHATGEYGWDTSQIKNQTVVDCMQKYNDAQFIVFTAMDNGAVVDPDVCNELKFAKNSGIPKRDVRFVPCPTCSKESASEQFKMMMDNLNANCPTPLWSGRVWLDMNTYQFWAHPWNPIGKSDKFSRNWLRHITRNRLL